MTEIFLIAFALFGLLALGTVIGYVVTGLMYMLDFSLDLAFSYEVMPWLQYLVIGAFTVATPIVGGTLLL